MKTAGWIAFGALFLAGYTWAIGSFCWSHGFVEGQATQDAAYGLRLDQLLDRIERAELR